ncbi:MAG: 23S rRNA (pseudouridine(1915)-N(3))-methyltransferase RlmH [Coriobacteriales bacterium]
MKIEIVAVGKLKERFWKDAVAEYVKRLGGYAQVRVMEVADRDPAKCGGEGKAREREGADILKACGPGHVILLAIDGKERSSEGFAHRLESLMNSGKSDIVFVIGGSTGVSDEVRKRADETLSFGPITLPHNLARVVLVEQVYRAFKIMRGEPYHK